MMESLSCGVPMVALPVTNDQPAVSARVRRAGVGEIISLHRLTSRRLRAAAQRILSIPDYHTRAVQLKMSIERAGGVERAADVIEGLLSSRADAESLDRHRVLAKVSAAGSI